MSRQFHAKYTPCQAQPSPCIHHENQCPVHAKTIAFRGPYIGEPMGTPTRDITQGIPHRETPHRGPHRVLPNRGPTTRDPTTESPEGNPTSDSPQGIPHREPHRGPHMVDPIQETTHRGHFHRVPRTGATYRGPNRGHLTYQAQVSQGTGQRRSKPVHVKASPCTEKPRTSKC
jgi:hypothetical protein